MIDFLVNIGQVETISAAFPWAVSILAAMLAAMGAIWVVKKIETIIHYKKSIQVDAFR